MPHLQLPRIVEASETAHGEQEHEHERERERDPEVEKLMPLPAGAMEIGQSIMGAGGIVLADPDVSTIMQ